MYGISAAHKTLPFGTIVKVVDLETTKSVVVTINDRGPFIAVSYTHLTLPTKRIV